MVLRGLTLATALAVLPSLAYALGGVSTVCYFNAGPRNGTHYDFAQMGYKALPVGTPCLDGAGSTGYLGTPLSTVCYFNAGPRAGTNYNFAQMGYQALAVGTPCHDGAGSTGILR